MLKTGRFELVEQIDSVSRLRKVLQAADRHLAAIQAYLEQLEFDWRYDEDEN